MQLPSPKLFTKRATGSNFKTIEPNSAADRKSIATEKPSMRKQKLAKITRSPAVAKETQSQATGAAKEAKKIGPVAPRQRKSPSQPKKAVIPHNSRQTPTPEVPPSDPT